MPTIIATTTAKTPPATHLRHLNGTASIHFSTIFSNRSLNPFIAIKLNFIHKDNKFGQTDRQGVK
ncbi:MAG: hypothetical protein HDS46_03245 [Bacteroides sp.]|nr:hypothetical protein [Bacteroides sp.]